MPDFDAALDDDIGDDLLRLIFTACHPVLSREARAALTLRVVGGLTTEEIARAFLVPEPTIAQRIVRAKRTLAGIAKASLRGAARRGTGRNASLRCSRSFISSSTRAMRRPRRGLAPPGCARKRCARPHARPNSRRRSRKCTGCVALMELHASRASGAYRPRRRADPAAGPEPGAVGPASDSPRIGGAGASAAPSAVPAGPYRCRPRSRPAMRGRAPPMRPTGAASRRCMGNCRRWRRRPSSNSTARWRSAWPRDRKRGSLWSIVCFRARAEELSPAAERARRPAARARPPRRSARRVRSGGGPCGRPARTGVRRRAAEAGGAAKPA